MSATHRFASNFSWAFACWLLRKSGASNSTTPLLEAARRGHEDVVELLLAVPDIDVNLRGGSECSSTPLLSASARGHHRVVKRLLDAPGIEVNMAGCHGRTPLWSAASCGHLTTVQALLAAPSVLPNKADKEGRTPLWAAAHGGRKEVVEALLQVSERWSWTVSLPPHEHLRPVRSAPPHQASRNSITLTGGGGQHFWYSRECRGAGGAHGLISGLLRGACIPWRTMLQLLSPSPTTAITWGTPEHGFSPFPPHVPV